jgi:hypothetical protein
MKNRNRTLNFIILILIVSVCLQIVYSTNKYQVKKILQPSNPLSNIHYGSCISLTDNLIVIGSPNAPSNGVESAGNVIVFNNLGDLRTTLESPKPESRSLFGASLAVKNELIIIGEPNSKDEDQNISTPQGSAYLFDSEKDVFLVLESPNGDNRKYFGYSVTFCGDDLLISEPGSEVEGVLWAGLVHKYDKDGEFLCTLQSPEPCSMWTGVLKNFGYSIDGCNDFIVVGEPFAMIEELNQAGKVHIYNIDGSFNSTLQSVEPQNVGKFGEVVACNGDIIVVGESNAEVNGLSRAGKVHVFNSKGSSLFSLNSPKPEEGGRFGVSIGIDENIIVIGETNADVLKVNEGKVHVYDIEGNIVESISSPDPQVAAGFGYSINVLNGTISVGEPFSSVNGHRKSGKVYLFELGVEVQETIEETTPETEEPESEPRGGIPAFPIISIFAALMIYYLIQKWM